ncbi:hypothetical protein BCR43DRAFT_563542 [Syncephalastrum racemosum]|uniref:PX domain-containing protein n=1 Tax=Syncephalastrum racemosum TaxID=13706 RepID=A0A1X2HBM5_SYNRA|nr:hypothetical protein BCR43DRAFT_563542 [Syncephalastrum racemosum]
METLTTQINELLEACQSEWARLQHPENTGSSSPIALHSQQELHHAIKKLVTLQDEVEDKCSAVTDKAWADATQSFLEQTKRQLRTALSEDNTLSSNNNDDNSNDSSNPSNNNNNNNTPMLTSTSTSSSTLSSLLLPERRHSKSGSFSSLSSDHPIHSISEEEHPKPPSVEIHTSLFDQSRNPPTDPTLLFAPSPTTAKTNSTPSLPSLPIHHTQRTALAVPEASRSTLVDPPRQRLRVASFFQGLKPTRSTPLPNNYTTNNSGTNNGISFYRDDDQSGRNYDEIFASDAIVHQPLRIGAGYGSYICYNCTILSDKGPPITVRKRYSDFVDLREELVRNFPRLKKSIPKLPPKKVVGKFTPSFVEQRRRDLEYFFKYVALHPTLGRSLTVTHWIAP